ncbi:unnamed protein product [Polarella glacialis]|uniref:Protein phosphatase methylesterase 1 n=1 Tax=Polarella glacialis TaxID=89957 RepID=A0A813HTV5_POLGL|nr:unnamed protein product [Polarella glacialis]
MLAPPPPPVRKVPCRPEREKAEKDDAMQGSGYSNWICEELQLESGRKVRTYWWPACSAAVGQQRTAILCLHGAGDVGLVWAPVASLLVADGRLPGTTVVAADLRGHGLDEDDSDLCISRLVSDALELVETVSTRLGPGTGVVLAGHSLGGSVAARAAAEGLSRRPPLPVRAALLLDTVEGTALEGLTRTAAWLRARPHTFRSPAEAVRWALAVGMLQNERVARLTVPARLRQLPAIAGRPGGEPGSSQQPGAADVSSDSVASVGSVGPWCWRAKVSEAEQHWRGWFEGLSQIFTALPLPKLLVVGGVDRLDGPLEAAHMQGRFKLSVVPHSGHQLHEDRPEEVAEAFAAFLSGLQRQQAAFVRLQAEAGPATALSPPSVVAAGLKRNREHRGAESSDSLCRENRSVQSLAEK